MFKPLDNTRTPPKPLTHLPQALAAFKNTSAGRTGALRKRQAQNPKPGAAAAPQNTNEQATGKHDRKDTRKSLPHRHQRQAAFFSSMTDMEIPEREAPLGSR